VLRSWKSLIAVSSLLAVGFAGCSGGGAVPTVSGISAAGKHTGLYMRPGFARIQSQPPDFMQMAFVMTDGTILTQSYSNNATWYKYTPDEYGDYSDGTWTQVGSLQSGYGPSAFASDVLANGKFAIIGGEYNTPGQYDLQLTNLGAVYDPTAGTWTPLGHPNKWGFIGDSPSTVAADGRMLVGQKLTEDVAALDPTSLQWTILPHKGKADFNSEEGWTLLPDGTILTADVKDAPNSEIYNPKTGLWKSAGSTVANLRSPTDIYGCLQYGPKPKDCYYPPGEIGPALLRPDGTVFATGSNSGPSGSGAGHTAVYTVKTGKWAAGPDIPNGDNAGDSFAALLPSGDVLVFGLFGGLYEYNGKSFTDEGEYGGAPVLLPTGQVLIVGNSTVLYTGKGKPKAAWAPKVTTFTATMTRGQTYTISGKQFNGMGQAMSFGDEYQNATNYPLVRITMTSSGHVFYARTHDHSSMGVQTGSLAVSTKVDIPTTMPAGSGSLVVVANGIPSKPVAVTIK
jgi:hypothetical protein